MYRLISIFENVEVIINLKAIHCMKEILNSGHCYFWSYSLQLEIITGCACLSPEAGVLNTIVCTEPEDVPIHKVGKALESETDTK